MNVQIHYVYTNYMHCIYQTNNLNTYINSNVYNMHRIIFYKSIKIFYTEIILFRFNAKEYCTVIVFIVRVIQVAEYDFCSIIS